MDLNKKDDGKDELFKAVLDCNLQDVRNLINVSNDLVNCPDESGKTPLQIAAWLGFNNICELLVERGADVNVGDQSFSCPLMLATKRNDLYMVRFLIERGAIINTNVYNAANEAYNKGYTEILSIMNRSLMKNVLDSLNESHNLLATLWISVRESLTNLSLATFKHPVKLIMQLRSDEVLLQNLGQVTYVLRIISEQELEKQNEWLSWNCHFVECIFSAAFEFLHTRKEIEHFRNVSDRRLLDWLLKTWIENNTQSKYSPTIQILVKKSIMSYPFKDNSIYNALKNVPFHELFNAQGSETCETCHERNHLTPCSGCNTIYYCSEYCKNMHSFVHKIKCNV